MKGKHFRRNETGKEHDERIKEAAEQLQKAVIQNYIYNIKIKAVSEYLKQKEEEAKKMIYAKTKMRRIPKTCKDCSLSYVYHESVLESYRTCSITSICCPWEKQKSGNYGYGKPKWCPLVEAKHENGGAGNVE